MLISGVEFLEEKDRNELLESCRKAQGNGIGFHQFKNEYGWADWMQLFCDMESDDHAITERESYIIDDTILQAWRIVEEG